MKVQTQKAARSRMLGYLATGAGVALLVVLFPLSVEANMGLPMVAVFLPPMWLALAPIILVETVVVARATASHFGRIAAATAVANIVSTLVGVPLLWCLLAGSELALFGTAVGLESFWTKLYSVTVQAPWLIPYDDQFYWMVPIAFTALAIPFLLLSAVVEFPIVRRIARLPPTKKLTRIIVMANVASYAGLGVTIGVFEHFNWTAGLWATWPFGPVVNWLTNLAIRIAGYLAL